MGNGRRQVLGVEAVRSGTCGMAAGKRVSLLFASGSELFEKGLSAYTGILQEIFESFTSGHMWSNNFVRRVGFLPLLLVLPRPGYRTRTAWPPSKTGVCSCRRPEHDSLP